MKIVKTILTILCLLVFGINAKAQNYAVLHDFGSDTIRGRTPFGSLVSDGTYLYGMTYAGGANGKGVIFKIKLDGTGQTVLFDFNGTNGSNFGWGLKFSPSFMPRLNGF